MLAGFILAFEINLKWMHQTNKSKRQNFVRGALVRQTYTIYFNKYTKEFKIANSNTEHWALSTCIFEMFENSKESRLERRMWIKSLEKFPENNNLETKNFKLFYTTMKKIGTFERDLPNKRQKCEENTSKMGEKKI